VRLVSVLALCLCPLPALGQEVDALIADLRSADWPKVEKAANRLVSLEGKAVPALLPLLDSREVVPLANTADLIYPGAKTFYGHGRVVNYALDSLAVRAGWILESMTFQDFGFRSGTITEDKLFQAMREHPGDMPMEQAVGPQRGPEPIAAAAAAARRWWESSGRGWTRYEGLLAALDGNDVRQQADALIWLRSGVTDCAGLDDVTYKLQIEPRARKLAASADAMVKLQAESLLREGLFWEKRMIESAEALEREWKEKQ
ncbi:MAG: hypothetical protein ACLGI9_24760, partial [Thermoanaerobaculia bacterium]